MKKGLGYEWNMGYLREVHVKTLEKIFKLRIEEVGVCEDLRKK